MKKPHDHRPARFAVLVVASNLLAACCTTIVIILAFSLYQRHYTNPEQQSSVRALEECCKCFDPYFGNEFYCPAFEGSIDIFTDGIVQISNSDPHRLCTVTVITPGGFLKPVWRSYDGRDWEASAGDYSSTPTPDCAGGVCNVTLPPLLNGTRYQLTSFNMPPYSTKDEIARFLEQATFGQTLADIATFDNNSSNLQLAFANWIKTQQTTVPLTSHRAYYRRRMNARYEFASVVGAVTHPCQKGTRYRRFLFAFKDYGKVVTLQTVGNFTNVIMDGFVRTVASGRVTVSGRVPLPDGK
jgi:hypothetical protein